MQPAAATQKGKEKKGRRNDGTRKRAEIDRAMARIDEPPRKITQPTSETSGAATPAAAASDAAAAGAEGGVAAQGMEVEETRQEGQLEIHTTDAELNDGTLSNDSQAEEGDASTAASFTSRPASRASSTEELQHKIDQMEREAGGPHGLQPVPEHGTPEQKEEQQSRRSRELKRRRRRAKRGGGERHTPHRAQQG